MGGYYDHEFIPKKGVLNSRKGGWVDPILDKVLNSTPFFKASLNVSDLVLYQYFFL